MQRSIVLRSIDEISHANDDINLGIEGTQLPKSERIEAAYKKCTRSVQDFIRSGGLCCVVPVG